jgi:NADP-dependent aldehyde dehydrogenase
MVRFGALQCYDAVRPERLPAALQDTAPTAEMWRIIDGAWVQG